MTALPDGVLARSDPEALTPTHQILALTVGGSPDVAMRVSRIAETWYTQQGSSMHQVALVEGMNRGDVMDIIHDAVNQMDLPSEIGSEATRAVVADLIVGFAAGSVAFQTEALDASFSPFVDVFVKQEGGWWPRALRRQTASTLRLQCATGVFASRCRVGMEVSFSMVHTILFGTA